MLQANPGAPPRDTGELLNRELSRQIRQTSVRIRKKGKVTAGTDGRDDSGLVGAVDLATHDDSAAAAPKSVAVGEAADAAFDSVSPDRGGGGGGGGGAPK
jgi:hypothetical protein